MKPEATEKCTHTDVTVDPILKFSRHRNILMMHFFIIFGVNYYLKHHYFKGNILSSMSGFMILLWVSTRIRVHALMFKTHIGFTYYLALQPCIPPLSEILGLSSRLFKAPPPRIPSQL